LKSLPGIRYGLSFHEESPILYITSEQPLRTLNSSIWGGGFGYNRNLINRQVHKSYTCENPPAEMRDFLDRAQFASDDSVGMLTAAWVDHAGHCEMSLGELHVCSWVTVGLGNPARAGVSLDVDQLYPGTINCIVLIDGQLSDSAMVNAVITVTEAKTAVLQELNVTVGTGGPIATGTSTDAVLIAATDRGRSYSYAGTATRVGYLIGKTVYEAGMQASLAYKEEMSRRAAAAGRSMQ
jgi:adenosylcobinamide amidohydrolase